MWVDAFHPAEEFKSHMDNWIGRFREAKTIPNQEKVLIPGDIEREMEAERLKSGWALHETVVKDLEALGEKWGVHL